LRVVARRFLAGVLVGFRVAIITTPNEAC
jgi:hypothetical protein